MPFVTSRYSSLWQGFGGLSYYCNGQWFSKSGHPAYPEKKYGNGKDHMGMSFQLLVLQVVYRSPLSSASCVWDAVCCTSLVVSVHIC
jgi:hypothetical protein